MHSKTVEVQQYEGTDDLYIDLGQDTMDELGWEDEWTAPDPFIADVGEKPTSKELEEINKEPATETKSDIFELEQSLMRCWGVVEDMKSVYNAEGIYND